jgi:hypothetical protein
MESSNEMLTLETPSKENVEYWSRSENAEYWDLETLIECQTRTGNVNYWKCQLVLNKPK